MSDPPNQGKHRRSRAAPANVAAGNSASPRTRPAKSTPPHPKTSHDIARMLAERDLPGRRGGAIVWLWIIALPVLLLSCAATFLNGEWSWFWPLLGAALTAASVYRISGSASEQRAALLLPGLNRDWIGPLIDALHHPNASVRSIARLRLTTVLPTLYAADTARISPSQHATLFDHLSRSEAYFQPDLTIAILRFAAAWGNEQALTSVEDLAEMSGYTWDMRRVRAVARACLPRLESRIADMARASSNHVDFAPSQPVTSDPARPKLSLEAQEWLAEIDAESGKRPGMRFGFLLATWGVIVPYMLYQAVNQLHEGSPLLALACAVAAIGASQFYRFTLTPEQARLAAKMSVIDDVQAVGPLAEMTAWPDDRLKSMAQAALTRLLPRMNASDSQLLSADQRAILYRTLKLGGNARQAEFQISLLSALEQVGDTEALPFVRALAASQTRSPREKRVVDAANTCLPFLESCARQNTHSQTLLRAVSDSVRLENLVRPAGRQGEVDPDLLIRVAAPPD